MTLQSRTFLGIFCIFLSDFNLLRRDKRESSFRRIKGAKKRNHLRWILEIDHLDTFLAAGDFIVLIAYVIYPQNSNESQKPLFQIDISLS